MNKIRANAEPPLNSELSTFLIGNKELIEEDLMYHNYFYTNTEEDFNTVSTLFKKLEIQFHSYANKQDKKRHVVLKNLHCATPQDIIDELEKDHSVSVTKCVLMKRKQQSEQNGDNFTPTYFITLANPEQIGVIKRIKFLGSFKVKCHTISTTKAKGTTTKFRTNNKQSNGTRYATNQLRSSNGSNNSEHHRFKRTKPWYCTQQLQH
ncbi:hypothetical protein KQX54_010134 [Cotesia glomerata]|uniref:Pre-C2HC domain-containing protein n=1 Tax=Cotesia glomerata TaxID=32391 RepID=A0AAV7I0L9_COTGL|nr:hypothetical protein KQX54_010134 [Cotesia glomerata]